MTGDGTGDGTRDRSSGLETSTATDLRLVAVTTDRSHLVLEDSDNRQFRVPVDERLAVALRPERTRSDPARPGQLEIALESQLSPREIQARIRAGHSIHEVSRAAGVSVDRVERYAAPVVDERKHVVEQAQRAPGRRASGGTAPTLVDLVQARLAERAPGAGTAERHTAESDGTEPGTAEPGIAEPDATEWDAWRGDDDRWTVRLSYRVDGRARVATWAFDPRGRVLSPADDEARWLVDDSGADRAADQPAAAIRRLASVPITDGDAGTGVTASPVPQAGTDEVYDREVDEKREVAAPARQVASVRAGRRLPVPSWDDIMFGTRKRD